MALGNLLSKQQSKVNIWNKQSEHNDHKGKNQYKHSQIKLQTTYNN